MNERRKIRRAVADAFEECDEIIGLLTDHEVSVLSERITTSVMAELEFEDED